MNNSMRIKVLKSFPSPLTNRMAEVDSELNVPKSQFWFKRIEQKDCIEIKKKTKSKASENTVAPKLDKKGSK